jgi:hypothetical protein
LVGIFSAKGYVVSQDSRNDPEQKRLSAAFEEASDLSAWILAHCIEENQTYFQSNPVLLEKVSERLDRGRELAKTASFRAANIIQRHAIDLILQEDHRVFKDSARLRKALLRYRDHDVNVITPLWESQRDNIN